MSEGKEKKVGDFLVSKTDTKGKITYCNNAFVEISGFSERELIGAPHSIVRHPDMPRAIFKFLWSELAAKNEVNVFVKNRAKDGGFYWVFANITPSFNAADKVIGYYSVRRKPNPKALETIKDFYRAIRDVESTGGMDAGLEYFYDFFRQKGQTYGNFVVCLQLDREAV